MAMVPEVITRRRLTYDDYLALPDDQDYEIIDGVLYVSPRARPDHQRVSNRIAFLLTLTLEQRGLGVVVPDADLIVDEHNTYVSPDIMFFWTPRFADVNPAEQIRIRPDLIIEILSPSTDRYDLVTKRQTYARLGVPHYWIADPSHGTIIEHTNPADSDYSAVRTAGPNALFHPALHPDLAVDLSQVFI